MRTKRHKAAQVYYPESDGKPMAETDFHRDWMGQIIEILKSFCLGKWIYVSGNLLVYYMEGNPKKSIAPDVFVAKNCDPRRRRIFKIWEEGVGPSFIMEVTSKKTRRQDLGAKKEIYAQLNVAEYFLYDPLAEWLTPALQGYRLVNGEYIRMEAGEAGGLVSEQLGITFRLEERELALFSTATGQRLQSAAEQRVQELEEELARLQAERGR
jgi:Uma2 family endonuclease